MTQEKPDLSTLSDEELMIELANRRASRLVEGDLTTVELATEINKADEGARVLAKVIAARCDAEDGTPRRCPKCGARARVEAKKQSRTIRTLSGQHTYKRNYFRCSGCRHGFSPVDDELGVPSTGRVSLEVEKRITDFGVNDVFEEAAARFSMHYGWSISENLVRRTIDRVADAQESIPEPVHQNTLLEKSSTPAELLTLSVDGSMLSTRSGWQEFKVGVVVRDEHHIEGTRVRRGAVTQARYVTATDLQDLKERFYAAAVASGLETAKQVVFVSDGAVWIRNLAQEIFPTAILVLDWPHVVEHLAECGRALLSEYPDLLSVWMNTTKTLVWSGRAAQVVKELRELLSIPDVDREPVTKLLRYLTSNLDRMDYPDYRAKGFPVGSGVVESAQRHVLQVRMKRAGQHWNPKRAARMARLRAASRTAGPHFASRIRQAQKMVAGF